MQGTILILDGVATNRIMLKVQLSAAYYRIVQGVDLASLPDLLNRARPDLILTAMKLPDGTAAGVKAMVSTNPALAGIPVLAIADQPDRQAMLNALAAGIDDVLVQPLNDLVFQARIRSLMRLRDGSEDLPLDTGRMLGFAEAAPPFTGPSRVALVTARPETGLVWRSHLERATRHGVRNYRMTDVHALMQDPVPDAIVVEVPRTNPGPALALLSDLCARSATENCVVIALADGASPQCVADALDRGAQNVMTTGFDAEELALRLDRDLARKARRDRFRLTVRDGLRAAVLDPMTGLYNRRYALPYLTSILHEAAENGSGLALMMADLDHFKRINDRHGHAAGDAVLVETSQRLRQLVRPADMVARVGGEEFLIVARSGSPEQATRLAHRICAEINARPFQLPGAPEPVRVTISIGVVAIGPFSPNRPDVMDLMNQADRALYESKAAGRNRFKMIEAAA
ncbi:diguanylate cyclase domain-containing protein [Chachezhania sediminis]|uniref:diguanylate cyclase domain-containing protein n=1 Tax=Chachezhania sediminis TaxID=2599291 RepID=UPI00131EB4F2|nr:diguanylate cyclase [Chachezhania sediminis]